MRKYLTKDLLRKFVKVADYKSKLEKLLGLENSEENKTFSVLRVSHTNNGLTFQSKGISKLSLEDKKSLKKELQILISKL